MDKLCAVCCGTCVWCDYNPKTDELMCKNPDSEGYKARTDFNDYCGEYGEGQLMDKTCVTCIDNDDGLCDRKGILVHDDDTCSQHKESWKDAMLRQFNRRTMRY